MNKTKRYRTCEKVNPGSTITVNKEKFKVSEICQNEKVYTQEMKSKGQHTLGMVYLDSMGVKRELIGVHGDCFEGVDLEDLSSVNFSEKSKCQPLPNGEHGLTTVKLEKPD